ncbi:hypothetical protein LOTGIDRAFT_152474 [Lottia gigantea]|uniref:SGNH domain-containing protein n=1 Tax=Lottia gigantea TaxID=225164 RepID=V4B551_LOTGI|nr:hypothetical protein LOTGIDRAFT_152474 [Lottia gigantea]ESP05618.1 hypothetical protein LOTGIDRAFT_152474 [Lottia gigantea]
MKIIASGNQNEHVTNSDQSNENNKECPNVLKYMTYGHWKPRIVSREEVQKMDAFLLRARSQHFLPANLQRRDGKCGNVSFEDIRLKWFRPLCHPKGPTPCCYNNVCANKSIEDCVCKDCYDMRTSINAEHADWIPNHKYCQVPSRTAHELCDFVKGSKIFFMGDSFIRHIYLAFILLLKDNLFDGAIRPGTYKGLHDSCTGLDMFTEKQCRSLLDQFSTLCNSTVYLYFNEFASTKHGTQIQQVMNTHARDPKAYFIVGTGLHDGFKITRTWNKILSPVLNFWKTQGVDTSKFLWHAMHAPGLLKTPFKPSQHRHNVIKYNKAMKKLLTEYNVPIFETFNLTDGVNSFDGPHYGQGVNLLKAKIILEFFREQRSNKTL